MKIIIAPAKQMKVNTDVFECDAVPEYIDKTRFILDWIRDLSFDEQKKLWGCSDKIAKQNHERFHFMNLERELTPAILAYDGIAFTYMAPAVFEDGQFDYVQKHLVILSAFYGAVKPLDGVVPYRLEMAAKISGLSKEKTERFGYNNFYDFWGESLYESVADKDGIIINLASKEYSKCIEKYLKPNDRYITVVFGELINNKVVQKGVYAKMARGEMVRYLAQVGAEGPDMIKAFNLSGYSFDETRSDDSKYVFLK